MAVNEYQAAEGSVQGRIERTSGEGREGKGDKAGCDEALKAPVIRAVGRRWWGNGLGIVYYGQWSVAGQGQRSMSK